MSEHGYRPVGVEALHTVLRAAGITEAARAKEVIRNAMEARPGGIVDGKECERVRKLVDSWLGLSGGHLRLQSKSFDRLKRLIGDELMVALFGHARDEELESTLAATVNGIERLLSPYRHSPHTLFADAHQAVRIEIAGALGQFARPHRHKDAVALKRTVAAYGRGGIRLALALEPFVRQWPYERSPRETDVGLLCAIVRFGNDFCQFVSARSLPAQAIPQHRLTRVMASTLAGMLNTLSHDPNVADHARAAAMYQLSRYHAIGVQIAGDSPFNLARCSEHVPLYDEDRFVAQMRQAIYFADQLSHFAEVPGLSIDDRKELRPTLAAIRLRGLCYVRNIRRRPTRHDVEGVLDKLSSPSAFAKKYSTRLRFYRSVGDLRAARTLCDELRQRLVHAHDSSLPRLLSPILTVNSYRCGGEVSSREYDSAIEELRAEPTAMFIYGHHLLSNGPNDELRSLL